MWINFTFFGPNKSDNMCNGEASERGMVSNVSATDPCSVLILPDWFFSSFCVLLVSISLVVAWGSTCSPSVCTGSRAPPGWHIQTCSHKQVCYVSQHTLKSMEKTPRVKRWELDRAIDEHKASSRTGICSFVRGGTEGALTEVFKTTSSRLLVCMFLTKLPKNRLNDQHCAAQLAFTKEHQNLQVRHWCPIRFTDESRLV